MKVGLALSDLPAYSETFFRNKIKVLQEQGIQVVIFTGHTNKKSDLDFKHAPKNYKSNLFLHLMSTAFIFIRLLILCNHKVLKFIKLERKDKKEISCIIKALYFNEHIFRSHMDWLHFGFSTLTVNNENIAKSIGAKMAVSFRGYDINVYPLKFPDAYNLLWTKLDKVHSISDSLYQKALLLGLNKSVPYQKITPAINIDFFKPEQRIFTNNGAIEMLTVARLTWIKGLDYSLLAIKHLKELVSDQIKYKIVGDGVVMDRLKFAIHELGIRDNVELLGRKNSDEILALMKQSDIYLQPSLDEGFCNAVIEAQSCGCLCIASDVGGLKENIVNGKTGWLVPSRSPELLALKIKEVHELPIDVKNKVVKSAQNRVKTEFSTEIQKVKFQQFYEE